MAPFEIVRFLSRGGSGQVFEVRVPGRAGTFAAKVLSDAGDPRERERFRREVLAASRLRHRHLVRVEGCGLTPEGAPYILFELVPGHSLREVLLAGGLPQPAALEVGRQLAQALAHLHEQQIVHRDVKPENVLIDPAGAVKLCDLGLAWSASAIRVTQSGEVCGSLPYLAPEQVSPGVLGPWTDVHAWGGVLYELLSGEPAFPATHAAVLCAQIRSAAPLPLRELCDVSPEVEALVARCLAKAPADRFASGVALAQALEALLQPAPESLLGTISRLTLGDPRPSLALPEFTPELQATPWSASDQRDRYALREVLGRGANSIVFRAWDPVRGEDVALKQILLRGPRVLERVQREVETQLQLEHPNLVRLLGCGGRTEPYLVMDYVEGRSLSDVIPELAGNPRRAVRILLGAARGMAYAHAAGVIHRDLKPGNILVEPGDRARVADFGLAKLLDDESGALTRSGVAIGTPAYMPPEQISACPGEADPRCDVYAFGATLYHALAGRPPFVGGALEVLVATVELRPQPPSAHAPAIDPGLDRICLRCLEKDPQQRYAGMDEVVAALETWLAGDEPGSAGWPRRGLALLGAVAIAVAVASGVVAVAGILREPEEPTSTATEFEVDFSRAFDLLDEGLEPSELLALARRRLAQSPQDSVARVAEGVALLEMRDAEAALASARALVREDPANLDAIRLEVGSLFRMGRTAEAKVANERLLDADPFSEIGWTFASLLALEGGDVEGALHFAEKALTYHPGSAKAATAHGNAALWAEDLERALADFDLALTQRAPPVTHFNRAVVLFKLGRHAEALVAVRSLELPPGQEQDRRFAELLELRCLARLDPHQAEQITRAKLEREPGNAMWTFVLGEAFRVRRDPEAARWFEETIRLDPDSDLAEVSRGYLADPR